MATDIWRSTELLNVYFRAWLVGGYFVLCPVLLSILIEWAVIWVTLTKRNVRCKNWGLALGSRYTHNTVCLACGSRMEQLRCICFIIIDIERWHSFSTAGMFVWIDWRVMVICVWELQIQTICQNTHSPGVTLSLANNHSSQVDACVWVCVCVHALLQVNRRTWYLTRYPTCTVR